MKFSKFINKVLKEKEISGSELARWCGLSRASICQYRKGVVAPSMKTAELICEVLQVQYVIGEKAKGKQTRTRNINKRYCKLCNYGINRA